MNVTITSGLNPTVLVSTAYIALGSNLGQRLSHLRHAAFALEANPQIDVIACSRIYETAPVGGPAGQGAFLNAVLQLTTTLTARALLDLMLAIELARGRKRAVHWGARTLDLDLLLWGDEHIYEPGLIVPHPRLAERNFVLVPLCDLAPDFIMPGYQQTVKELTMQAGEAGVKLTQFTF